MLETILDAIYDFFYVRPGRKLDANAHQATWATFRLGSKVVFFDPVWAETWYRANAVHCTHAIKDEPVAVHSLKRIAQYRESIWIKRLRDEPKKIAKAFAKKPTERLAYHVLNFAFSTNDTHLLSQVTQWLRNHPDQWFSPKSMAAYAEEDIDGHGDPEPAPGEHLCLFARLFESIHALEWLFQHAPDLKASLQDPSAWRQLLHAMQEMPKNIEARNPQTALTNSEANNRTFQKWPLVASQCFGHQVSPLLPTRQPLLGHFYDTLQAYVHNPAAQCYYLRKARDQQVRHWGVSIKTKLANPIVLEFAHLLVPIPNIAPTMSLKGLQLMFINQMQDDTEFYLAAQKVFDGTFEMPAQPNYFENTPALDGTLFA